MRTGSVTPVTWEERDGALMREFRFGDFASAFAFATRVAMIAEVHQHHPDLCVSWGRVRVTTTTHDAGNTVTELDRRLTAAIDEVVRS